MLSVIMVDIGRILKPYRGAGNVLIALAALAITSGFGFTPVVHAYTDIVPECSRQLSQPETTNSEELWSTTAVFEGSGSNSTPHFSIHGNSWRIKWSAIPEYPDLSTFSFFVNQSSHFTYPVTSMLDEDAYQDNTVYLSNEGQEYYLKVIAANIREWTITVQEQTGINTSPVKISYIKHLGTEKKSYEPTDITVSNETANGSGFVDPGEIGPVCHYKNEPDEYVVITNTGSSWVDISGWTLSNTADGLPLFTFPEYLSTCPPYYDNYLDCGYNCIPPAPCMLGPHQSFRVYTDEINSRSGGFSFNYGPGNMWNNEKADTAVLYDAEGNEISRKSYIVSFNTPVESPVQITRIYYRGTVSSYGLQAGTGNGLSEANEYVVIKNTSGCFQDLSGWKLMNETRELPAFIFPHGYYLCPFETVRVYTDEIHPEWDGLCSKYNAGKLLFDYYNDIHNEDNEKCKFFPLNSIHQGSHLSFNYSNGNMWSNDNEDVAALYNAQDELINKRSYSIFGVPGQGTNDG